MLVREELARAAGFFNGEGTTYVSITAVARHIKVQVAQTSDEDWEVPDDLLQFKQAVGVGVIHGPYRKNKNPTYRPEWRFHGSGFESAQHVVAVLWPWLSEAKRLQAMSALETYRQSTRRSYRRIRAR